MQVENISPSVPETHPLLTKLVPQACLVSAVKVVSPLRPLWSLCLLRALRRAAEWFDVRKRWRAEKFDLELARRAGGFEWSLKARERPGEFKLLRLLLRALACPGINKLKASQSLQPNCTPSKDVWEKIWAARSCAAQSLTVQRK